MDLHSLAVVPLLLGLAAAAATLAGGALALRFERRMHLVLGFSAGAVVGVALFDLIPETLALNAASTQSVMTALAIGFLAYLAADRALATAGPGGRRGHLGAGSLTLHSVMDGLAIGLAFQASTAVAAVVTLAVLAHDLSDGVNTVNVSLTGGAGRTWARRWLWADAIAPLVGVVLSGFIGIPKADLAVVLAAFAGFFLCIGACELVPASYKRHPTLWTTVSTIAGCAFIWAVVRLADPHAFR